MTVFPASGARPVRPAEACLDRGAAFVDFTTYSAPGAKPVFVRPNGKDRTEKQFG